MALVNTKNPASPAVIKRTLDFTSVVRPAQTQVAAYVGNFPWGPVEKCVDVFDTNDQIERFGKPQEWNYLDHFAVVDYLAYANPVMVYRVIDEDASNAYSGNQGTGFVGTAQVVNGEIQGITFVDGGENYVVGDIIPLETTHEVVVQAVFEVTTVDSSGAITGVVAVENGRGYVQDDVLSASDITIQIRNADDFLLQVEQGCAGLLTGTTSLNATYPNFIARYPGDYGNSLLVSSARASEFDAWEYSSLFSVAPAADEVEYEIAEGQNVIIVDADVLADFQSDWVVTVNGLEVTEGADPGQYTIDQVANTITINVDSEDFTGNNTSNEFVLANLFDTPTTNVRVTLNGEEVTPYTGAFPVPNGRVSVNGNIVRFGNVYGAVSGDGINTNYQINFGSDSVDLTDLKVTVDGIVRTVVDTGPVATGEVLAAVIVQGSDNILTLEFFAGEEPALGSRNITAETGFLDGTDNINVTYNYPAEGSLKIFGNQTEVHVVVVDQDGKFGSGEANEILESYSFLSLIPGTKDFNGSLTYYKDAINKTSSYIWVGSDIRTHTTVSLSRGTDSMSITNAERINGWKAFVDPDEKQFSYLIAGAVDTNLANWIIDNILECRCDVVGAFSPEFEDVVCVPSNAVTNILAWRKKIRSSSFAILDSGWKLRYDEINDVYRWLPLNPDTIGIVSASVQQNGSWVSPAGTVRGRYKNVVRLAFNPEIGERNRLYPNDVNPVFNVKNVGPTLYGDKTAIGRNSAFGEIAVRLLFIKVQNDVAEFSREFFFEANNDFTRSRFRNTVTPYLRNLLGQNAFDDFRLVVDETNNTPEIINNQFLCANVLIRPNRSTNFVCLTMTNVRFGLEFEELIDSQRLAQ